MRERGDLRPRLRATMGAPAQILFGVAVIVTGLAFLLDNLGLIDVDFTVHLWPSLVILFGVLRIMQSRTNAGYVVGAGLILVGGMMLLNAMGLILIRWHTLWPLLLILMGLSVVFRSPAGRRRAGGLPPAGDAAAPRGLDKPQQGGAQVPADGDAFVDITAILGGYNSRVAAPVFRGGDITAIMGGCELDLRQCSIEGEAVLTVFALCGGISLKVPPDWSIDLRGTPILGGFEAKTIEAPHLDKRLVVRGFTILGGLEVRN